MLFTIKRPRSERFFQLSFKGFGPQGRNTTEKNLKTVFLYLKALNEYVFKRFALIFKLLGSIFLYLNIAVRTLKRFSVQKLIWSRGRLGRPVATFIIMSVAFFVFMFGKVFNSSKFVNSQEINSAYLATSTDIIPQKNTALTTLPENRQRTEPQTYTVQEGDTLSSIGNQFKVSIDALRYVNNLSEGAYLKVGQQVTIPPIAGLVHKVQSGDSLQSIATKYGVPSQAIADFNYLLDPSKLASGTELVIPGAKIPQPVIIPIVPATIGAANAVDASASKGWCMWPTTVRIITQNFSWYHNGVDIATPWGSMPPLFACASGTVVRAGWDPWGLGLHVRIDHGNGYETVYGHMSRVDVSYGEEVDKGEGIGLMGNTGNSTGPHVHFILKYKGTPQNPLRYIN